ncbi:MAG: hypothetical protein ABIB47_06385 [Candidatus Woesearchaeota archaeon]
MEYRQKKILTYIGLTILLLASFFIVLMFDILDTIGGFGLFILFIFIIIFFTDYFFRHSKGNISKYPIDKFTLVWKDNWGKKAKRKPNPELHLYKEGIKYLNYFIEWKDVKQISYPKTFEASKKVGRFIPEYRSISSSDTLRVMDKNDKVYLIEISDVHGFENAINKLNKKSLIK